MRIDKTTLRPLLLRTCYVKRQALKRDFIVLEPFLFCSLKGLELTVIRGTARKGPSH